MRKVLYPPVTLEKPKEHPPRVITKFLLFPKTLINEMGYRERRWLETASYLEEYKWVEEDCELDSFFDSESCSFCAHRSNCVNGTFGYHKYVSEKWLSGTEAAKYILDYFQQQDKTSFDKEI